MTNTSPITTSNFVAGTIGVGIALLIMPQIIMGTVGAQQKGVARTASNSLVEDINNVCSGDDEESGSIDLQSGYEIVLDYQDFKLKNPDGETIESRQVACNVNTQTTVTAGDYTVNKREADDGDTQYSVDQ